MLSAAVLHITDVTSVVEATHVSEPLHSKHKLVGVFCMIRLLARTRHLLNLPSCRVSISRNLELSPSSIIDEGTVLHDASIIYPDFKL